MGFKPLMIKDSETGILKSVYVHDKPEGTDKILLEYNGTNILKPDGGILQFEELYSMLMERPDFVVLVYNNRAYHPNQVSTEQVVFVATYPSNGYIHSERITLLASGAVTTTFGEAEKISSRVSAITDANKDDAEKYPSVKAVVEYVQAVLDEYLGQHA